MLFNIDSDSIALEWGLRFRFSNKLPGDVVILLTQRSHCERHESNSKQNKTKQNPYILNNKPATRKTKAGNGLE